MTLKFKKNNIIYTLKPDSKNNYYDMIIDISKIKPNQKKLFVIDQLAKDMQIDDVIITQKHFRNRINLEFVELSHKLNTVTFTNFNKLPIIAISGEGKQKPNIIFKGDGYDEFSTVIDPIVGQYHLTITGFHDDEFSLIYCDQLTIENCGQFEIDTLRTKTLFLNKTPGILLVNEFKDKHKTNIINNKSVYIIGDNFFGK